MTVEIIFEYHSTSVDNEARIASGWRDPSLSSKGREQAKELGERRRGDHVDAVFCSDLRRAVETAEVAFGASIPIHSDNRLREYNYGTMTGSPPDVIHSERPCRVDTPFPESESLRDVANRVRRFLDDLARDCDSTCVVVIGHGATKLALDHLLGGMPLEEAAAQTFTWEAIPPSWRYVLVG
ncbi:MAG TPA: histidine phosphatase family protein [Dehalococcoidia bacterium]|jgi:broad specificity phosphatase PhoE|nr:histidine phosphatase family protein [Dehalococcoidia bacterium]